MVFAVVDLETNQREKGRYAQILEIGIVLTDGYETLDEYQTLVHPGCSVDPHITALTGITDELLVGAPSFAQVAQDVQTLLTGPVFVAHNVGFDHGHLRFHLGRQGHALRRDRLCTVKLTRALIPGLSGYGLAALDKEFKLGLEGHHRALADARATAELLKMLVREKGLASVLAQAELGVSPENLPPELDRAQIELLPEGPGVLWVWAQNELLVVKSCSNLYRCFQELAQTWGQKASAHWSKADRIEWKSLSSSIVGRIVASQASWNLKPRLGKLHKVEKKHDWVQNGVFEGTSSTGVSYKISVQEGLIESWEIVGLDQGYLFPALPVPSYVRTALLQGKLRLVKPIEG